MLNLRKLFGASIACAFGFAAVFAAGAAESPRAATNTNRAIQTANVYMPTMPVAPISATGNVAVEEQTVPVAPQPKPQPKPQPETYDCADGGVRNSEYGVAECMNDILSCINNGALVGGLNDLFNEDMRNAIINGMGLCSIQVDKCISSVRVNCKPVYRAYADIWVDFNSRKIQPEYYNFVLRKTGLTPNQAENTCMLLDKNTYGSSFAAVANDGKTTAEYNKPIGAYNNQKGNVLIKTNPMGAVVNDGNTGVDGGRGHYARWDATTATCYLRVAAYNKDEQIKNSWLFGVMGDDRLAEVWRPAGDTFSCNKDLFGFSLLNKTDTAAVAGIGGGALLGAGVGAIAGGKKGDSDSSDNEALCQGRFDCGCISNANGEAHTPTDAKTDNEVCAGLTEQDTSKCEQNYYDKYCAKVAGYPQAQCKWNQEPCESQQSNDASNKGGAGRGALAGAAIGAGAGGVATAITAFVERSNITCNVGDGLNKVAFGKSHSIDTLKDFYVKWDLRLPDTVAPTSMVTNCDSWESACEQYTDLNQCKNVAIYYKPDSNSAATLVRSACAVSGGVCVKNSTVAGSYGACK